MPTTCFSVSSRRQFRIPRRICRERGAVLEVYERLSLLWEARSHDKWVDQIVKLHPKKSSEWDRSAWEPIDKVYKVVDDGWWQHLIDLTPDQRKVKAPTSTADPVEAYGTVDFKLTAKAELGLMMGVDPSRRA